MAESLLTRTEDAERHFNLKSSDYASFHHSRPVVIRRTGTGSVGTSLEWSHSGGRNWQIVSFHASILAAIVAFRDMPAWMDRDPAHYRILHES